MKNRNWKERAMDGLYLPHWFAGTAIEIVRRNDKTALFETDSKPSTELASQPDRGSTAEVLSIRDMYRQICMHSKKAHKEDNTGKVGSLAELSE